MRTYFYQSITLTTASEVKSCTTGNDTIDGSTTANTVSGDTIVDSTSTDSDILNIKMTASPATKATITGIETINADFAGFGITFDASSTSGGKIVATSSQAGNTTATINGVDGAKTLTVESSTGIKTLTMDDIAGNAAITVGTATTLNLNGTTDNTDSVKLNVSGSTVALASNGTEEFKTLNIAGSGSASTITLGASVVEIATTSSIVLTGDQSLTIKSASADLAGVTMTDSTTAGTTTLQITATTSGNDLSKVGADLINISGATDTHALTFATGDAVKFSFDVAATDIDLVASTGTTGTINIELTGDGGITDSNTTYFATVNVTANDSNTPDSTGTDFQAILNSDVTLNLAGATNVDLNAASVAKEVNASTMTGNLTASVVTAKVTKLTAGGGDDTITIGTTATAFTAYHYTQPLYHI